MKKAVFLVLLLMTVYAVEDYYQTLGLKKSATEQEIKKAFKKLSIKYHPDKNRGDEKKAQDKFIKIVNAYEVLKDPDQKNTYDQFGEEGLKQKQQGGGGQQGGNFDEMFSQFFRNGGGGGGHNSNFNFNFGNQQHQQQQQAPPKPKFFEAESDIYEIDLGALSKFLRRNEVWIIFFYKAEGRCEKHKKVWLELAEKYYGIFKVAAVNCGEEEELCQEEFKVRRTPTVLCYPANSRSKPVKYAGDWELQDLAKLAVEQMESFVQIVTTMNYENFIKEDINKFKVLLFTNKTGTPPLFKALSKDFKGKLNFGQVRESEQELISKFEITQFPTIIVLTDPVKQEGMKYESSNFKKDQIMKFLREHASKSQVTKKKESLGLLELTPETLSKGHCNIQDSGMCLLYINQGTIPEIHQQILQQLASFYSEEPIKFIYTTQSSISSHFPDVYKQTPAIVILKPKRKLYTAYTNAQISEEDLKSFIDNVLSGLQTFQQMNGVLDLENQKVDL